jgi:hypothetical protein
MALWVIFLIESCNTLNETETILEIKKNITNSKNEVCNVIENNKLNEIEKFHQLEIELKRLDSLSVIWESILDTSWIYFTDKDLKEIEDQNRILSEKIAKTIQKEMPKYKIIYE